MNQALGFLLERGLAIPQGKDRFAGPLPEILEDADNGLADPGQALGRTGDLAASHAQEQGQTRGDRGAGRPPGADRVGPADKRPEIHSPATACVSGLRVRKRSLNSSSRPDRWVNRWHACLGNLCAAMALRGRDSYADRGARSLSRPAVSTLPIRGRVYWRRPTFIESGWVDTSGANDT